MLARLVFFSDEPVNNAGTHQKRVARAEFFFAVFISVAPLMRRFAVQNIKNLEECSVCHDKYDEVVPALGHEENTDIERIVVEATCEKGGYTTLTCARCGKTYNIDETEALGHNYETGESVEATCNFAGYTAMKCSRCDKNYRKITAAKLSHTIGDD